jgi:2-dehydro-3-deoxygalactonokinase
MIAVDWGTSSLRVYRLDEAGRITDQRDLSIGLLACRGRFEAVLAELITGWDAEELIVMAGMVGSRNGWQEVPYATCPAGADEIAAGMVQLPAPGLPGRRIFIAPGLAWPGSADHHTPEVMRGEETQLLGLLDLLPGDGIHTVCLPGTHSKWATVQGGRITGFRTAMTGEVYAVLRQHSILGAQMTTPEPAASASAAADAGSNAAFDLGLATSRSTGGLLNHLFSVRARHLFGELPGAAESADYLSGLLIGHELQGLLAPDNSLTQQVHLIGSSTLMQRYQHALHSLGISAKVHTEGLVTRGLFALARRCGAG